MGKMLKSYIQGNEFLKTRDYLVSDNGLFHAIMQSDGNLCVYRGGEPANNLGAFWCSGQTRKGDNFITLLQPAGVLQVYQGTDPYHIDNDEEVNRILLWSSANFWGGDGPSFATVQDDGNFCIYKGTGPSNQGDYLWGTGVTDALSDFEISAIDYDVSHATIENNRLEDLYRQEVANNTDTPQQSSIGGSESVAEMSGWSSKLGGKIGVKTNFKSGIPFLADGKVEVTIEVNYEYTWNGSTTRTKVWTFNVPVTVPPKSKAVVVISVSVSKISVPYTLTGSFVLKSGARISRKIPGIYTGLNSHNLEVSFFKPAENGGYVPLAPEGVLGDLKVSAV